MKSTTKIMLIEDDHYQLSYYQTMLKGLKYQVKTGDGTRSIINLVERHQPQIILMDSFLPYTEGWKECAEIKQREYGRTIGIIGMSSDNLEQRWIEAGADLFMHKEDINPQTLEAAIARVLEKYRK